MPRLHAVGSKAPADAQPVAGFCHHAPRSAQVVAFRLCPGGGLAYKLAGAPTGPRR